MDTVGNPQNLSSDTSHRVSTSNDIEVSTYLEIAKQKPGQQPVQAQEPVAKPEREAVVIIVSYRYIANWYLMILPGRKSHL